MWPNGSIIRVGFLFGSTDMREKTIQYALEWFEHVSLQLDVVDVRRAEVRIAFTPGQGHWSFVGTDCHNERDHSKPTMNLDVDERTSELIFKRTVLHEFGHVLGCLHEHQSPVKGIKWDRPAVLAYFHKLGWSEPDVERNVFQQFSHAMTQSSRFDRFSIMLYPIPSEFTTDGFSISWNDSLSEMDKDLIAQAYPRYPEGSFLS